LIQFGDQVLTGLQGLKSKVGEAVKVAEVSDLVVTDVQPNEGTRNESVVEPLELVARHVEPVEVAQVRDETVEVTEVVTSEEGGSSKHTPLRGVSHQVKRKAGQVFSGSSPSASKKK